ncbi:MAG: 50S ribosomal protein L13 [Sphingobacteriales bacterium]|jgi:large subunit ribosomal protein L13|nr:50S ribosomal protein L13 [Sphingobacteriales bacterium]MBP9141276.1 50S ribosomal protein L13 [Chitinophagales bacterium]MDA0197940.1 50S ribosomal protein L13 [Bacteroidota bacterium]MBK6890830.1 50S ribosomal protein L13 [Sphingobacteriales bacterium]MBK7526117.1 50S ribosomal protein L13 [Sphingobacteriales bacterium]
MDTLSYKTKSIRTEDVKANWWIIDANGMVTGRLCSQIATILRGKNKPSFTPHVDCGDHVIVINAEKVRFTGSKLHDKEYVSHTGYPGGQRFATPAQMLQRKPHFVIEHAVKGMLPKNRLGRRIIKKLFVYAGEQHPHAAQKPQIFEISK